MFSKIRIKMVNKIRIKILNKIRIKMYRNSHWLTSQWMKRTKPPLLIKVSRVFQVTRNREEIDWIEAPQEMIDNKTETPLWSRDLMKREDQ
jgi:hypothetical protein